MARLLLYILLLITTRNADKYSSYNKLERNFLKAIVDDNNLGNGSILKWVLKSIFFACQIDILRGDDAAGRYENEEREIPKALGYIIFRLSLPPNYLLSFPGIVYQIMARGEKQAQFLKKCTAFVFGCNLLPIFSRMMRHDQATRWLF